MQFALVAHNRLDNGVGLLSAISGRRSDEENQRNTFEKQAASGLPV